MNHELKLIDRINQKHQSKLRLKICYRRRLIVTKYISFIRRELSVCQKREFLAIFFLYFKRNITEVVFWINFPISWVKLVMEYLWIKMEWFCCWWMNRSDCILNWMLNWIIWLNNQNISNRTVTISTVAKYTLPRLTGVGDRKYDMGKQLRQINPDSCIL